MADACAETLQVTMREPDVNTAGNSRWDPESADGRLDPSDGGRPPP